MNRAARSGGVAMDAFDYRLPPEAVAQQPAEPRASARLAVCLEPGQFDDATVAALPELVRTGDVVVVNTTRVLPARLRLRKASGGAAEVLLLEPADPAADPASARHWLALVRPGRRLAPGTVLYAGAEPAVTVGERVSDDGRRAVHLVDPGVVARHGAVALPPYIHTPLADPERYQTVYAERPGSVAAPTAGLHLEPSTLDALKAAGATVCPVELLVGLDTFRPVTAERPEDHVMHAERYRVPAATLDACRAAARVLAVGTTCVRALEAAASSGRLEGRTSLFIRGDYRFEVVDVLLTNFHLPRSSLLLLVDAFYGPAWRDRYQEALRRRYRFLSFGDAMLLGRGAGR